MLLKNKPFLSIIIPCAGKGTDIDALRDDIIQQDITYGYEVIPIYGVSPAGRARNQGAAKAKGKIFIFIDADIRLGNPFVLENLSRCLLDNSSVGAAAASVQIPIKTTVFEKIYSRQVPHCQSPIVTEITPVSVAASACCAVARHVFFRTGQFNAHIPRGQDPEFCRRLRRAGYTTVLAPQTWCYHHQPGNIKELINTHLRNGRSTAFLDCFYPGLNVDINPRGIVEPAPAVSKIKRVKRFVFSLFKAAATMRFLFILSKLCYGCGYLSAYIKYKSRQ